MRDAEQRSGSMLALIRAKGLEATLFGVLHIMLKESSKPVWMTGTGLVIDTLQVLAFPLAVRFYVDDPGNTALHAFRSVAETFGARAWLPTNTWCHLNDKFPVLWPVKLLRMVASTLLTVLYIPIFTVIVSLCPPGRNQCISGGTWADAAAAIIVGGAFAVLSAMTTLIYFDSRAVSARTNISARAHNRVQFLYILCKTVWVLAFTYTNPSSGTQTLALAWLLTLSNLAHLVASVVFLPFYSLGMNVIRCFASLVVYWVCLRVLSIWAGMLTVLVVVVAPTCVATVNYVLKYINHGNEAGLASISDNCDGSLVVYPYLPTSFHVEIATRSVLFKNRSMSTGLPPEKQIQAARRLYEHGVSVFSNAFLAVQYALFLHQYQVDLVQAEALMKRSEAKKQGFDARFLMFRYKTEQESVARSRAMGGTGMDIVGYLEYQQAVAVAVRAHKRANMSIKHFWRMLLQETIMYDELLQVSRSISQNVVKAETMYFRLLDKFPSSAPIARAMAAFLEQVRNDPERAEQYYARADTLQEEAARASDNPEKAYEDLAYMAVGRNGIITDASPGFARMLGYQAGELEGRPITSLMMHHVAVVHAGYVEHYLRSGETGMVGGGERTVPAVKSNGALVRVSLTITEMSDAQADLLRSGRANSKSTSMEHGKATFMAVGGLADGESHDSIVLYALTADDTFVGCSSAAEAFVGYSSTDLHGMPVSQLLPGWSTLADPAVGDDNDGKATVHTRSMGELKLEVLQTTMLGRVTVFELAKPRHTMALLRAGPGMASSALPDGPSISRSYNAGDDDDGDGDDDDDATENDEEESLDDDGRDVSEITVGRTPLRASATLPLMMRGKRTMLSTVREDESLTRSSSHGTALLESLAKRPARRPGGANAGSNASDHASQQQMTSARSSMMSNSSLGSSRTGIRTAAQVTRLQYKLAMQGKAVSYELRQLRTLLVLIAVVLIAVTVYSGATTRFFLSSLEHEYQPIVHVGERRLLSIKAAGLARELHLFAVTYSNETETVRTAAGEQVIRNDLGALADQLELVQQDLVHNIELQHLANVPPLDVTAFTLNSTAADTAYVPETLDTSMLHATHMLIASARALTDADLSGLTRVDANPDLAFILRNGPESLVNSMALAMEHYDGDFHKLLRVITTFSTSSMLLIALLILSVMWCALVPAISLVMDGQQSRLYVLLNLERTAVMELVQTRLDVSLDTRDGEDDIDSVGYDTDAEEETEQQRQMLQMQLPQQQQQQQQQQSQGQNQGKARAAQQQTKGPPRARVVANGQRTVHQRTGVTILVCGILVMVLHAQSLKLAGSNSSGISEMQWSTRRSTLAEEVSFWAQELIDGGSDADAMATHGEGRASDRRTNLAHAAGNLTVVHSLLISGDVATLDAWVSEEGTIQPASGITPESAQMTMGGMETTSLARDTLMFKPLCANAVTSCTTTQAADRVLEQGLHTTLMTIGALGARLSNAPTADLVASNPDYQWLIDVGRDVSRDALEYDTDIYTRDMGHTTTAAINGSLAMMIVTCVLVSVFSVINYRATDTLRAQGASLNFMFSIVPASILLNHPLVLKQLVMLDSDVQLRSKHRGLRTYQDEMKDRKLTQQMSRIASSTSSPESILFNKRPAAKEISQPQPMSSAAAGAGKAPAGSAGGNGGSGDNVTSRARKSPSLTRTKPISSSRGPLLAHIPLWLQAVLLAVPVLIAWTTWAATTTSKDVLLSNDAATVYLLVSLAASLHGLSGCSVMVVAVPLLHTVMHLSESSIRFLGLLLNITASVGPAVLVLANNLPYDTSAVRWTLTGGFFGFVISYSVFENVISDAERLALEASMPLIFLVFACIWVTARMRTAQTTSTMCTENTNDARGAMLIAGFIGAFLSAETGFGFSMTCYSVLVLYLHLNAIVAVQTMALCNTIAHAVGSVLYVGLGHHAEADAVHAWLPVAAFVVISASLALHRLQALTERNVASITFAVLVLGVIAVIVFDPITDLVVRIFVLSMMTCGGIFFFFAAGGDMAGRILRKQGSRTSAGSLNAHSKFVSR